MKCRICGIEYSDKVCKIHETRCKVAEKEIASEEETLPVKEETPIEEEPLIEDETPEEEKAGLTLEQMHEQLINAEDRTAAPSTIKRWNVDRCKKELGL